MFIPLDDLIAVLDPKFGGRCHTDLGVELADAAANVAPSSASRSLTPS